MPARETDRGKVVTRVQSEGWTLARHGAEHDIYKRVPPPGRDLHTSPSDAVTRRRLGRSPGRRGGSRMNG